MKNYAALIIENGTTNTITVEAKNMAEAKSKAATFGDVVFIGLDTVGAKLYK